MEDTEMSHIKKISFTSVGKQEGCTCDRCGQYIRNIWTVEYKEGLKMNYGIDCWEKVYKEGLNKQGAKLLKNVMKSIQFYEESLAQYVSGELTEDNDESYKATQADWNKDNCWYGKSFEEYKEWLVNDFFPYRIGRKQEELSKFSKVNFNA